MQQYLNYINSASGWQLLHWALKKMQKYFKYCPLERCDLKEPSQRPYVKPCEMPTWKAPRDSELPLSYLVPFQSLRWSLQLQLDLMTTAKLKSCVVLSFKFVINLLMFRSWALYPIKLVFVFKNSFQKPPGIFFYLTVFMLSLNAKTFCFPPVEITVSRQAR